MRRAIVLVTLVLGGCDKLFDLEPVSAREDGGVADGPRPTDDGRIIDDAGPCIPGLFDEDGDGIMDNCDACPTVTSNADDEDTDGLPDACDPNVAGGGDRILFAATFGDPAQLVTGFQSENAMHDATGNGRISLSTDAVLRTISVYEPTKIEIRFAGIGGANVTSTTSLVVGAVACKVGAGGCAGVNSATCITAAPGGASSEYPGAPATIRLLELLQDQDLPDCQVGNGTAFASAEPTMNVTSGAIELLTSSTSTALVESIVVYGALQP